MISNLRPIHIPIGDDARNTGNVEASIVQVTNFFAFLGVAAPSWIALLLLDLIYFILLSKCKIFNHSILHTDQVKAQHILQVIQYDHH